MSKTVWIARHGNRLDFVHPEWFLTALRRYDPPLSDDGIIQAKKLAIRLQSEKISHIFSSPFLRCIQTAHQVAEVLNLPIQLEKGLSEWLNPEWMSYMPEIHSEKELAVKYPFINWKYRDFTIPEYPENETAVITRTGETVKKIVTNFSGNILIVGHSITVLGATRILVRENTEIKPFLCCLMKLINFNDQWKIKLNCDTSHLITDVTQISSQ